MLGKSGIADKIKEINSLQEEGCLGNSSTGLEFSLGETEAQLLAELISLL